jgi:hypothetical protein
MKPKASLSAARNIYFIITVDLLETKGFDCADAGEANKRKIFPGSIS